MRNADICNIGVAGFTVTASPSSSFVLDAITKAETDAAFNKITFLDNYGSFLPTSARGNFHPQKVNNRTVIHFDEYQDSLEFRPLYDQNTMPELQGMVLENNRPGVLYHAMGVNGSSMTQYLKSSGFEKQISELNASLVVVSFGTIDAYVRANSIINWKNEGNARGDLIHFTQDGYYKQGDLLYDALMSHYMAR